MNSSEPRGWHPTCFTYLSTLMNFKMGEQFMGKFIIGFYVMVTLLLSGFAKADQFGLDAQLNQVTFEKSSLDFVVTGQSSDACTEQIIFADQTGTKGELIRFRVLEVRSLDAMCIQKITYFSKRIPTRDLVYLSRLHIVPEQSYILTVANPSDEPGPVEIEVLGSELLE